MKALLNPWLRRSGVRPAMIRSAFILVLAVAVMVWIGWGGSSSNDFTDRANAVCSNAAAQLSRANPKQAMPYIALVGRIADRLAALKAPPADRATLAAYVTDVRATDSLIARLYAASKLGAPATLASLLDQLGSLQTKSNSDSAALAALGPKHCGSGSPAG
jgi:hypothetical protein